ncbi:glyoxylate/hydroxypyruvate reductase A [Afifella sp. IM 167]|uniref:2-hydroxyacid dehydrogenase n=1 Tax=Afifella sp. IM 167 TaxID=2033586 RepID=UPI001CC9F22D|nr:glyoxylate/hydroxypyruvate reductase A [Afifella sp. IM 167]MBZ8133788.1 glyoxylate/hydroxypyruvate reductase A [Afifella sp. IM 167]
MTTVLLSLAVWNPARWLTSLQERLPDEKVIALEPDGSFAGTDAELAETEYLVAWKPQAELFARLPKLKAILSVGAGVDHLLDIPTLPDLPIARIVDPDLTNRMVEYVAWQALHHLRLGPSYQALQRAGQWRALPQPAAREVTVGIMGLGVLGIASAELLIQLGFRVTGWSRRAKDVAGVVGYHGDGQLRAFLGDTDILVCLLPDTPKTRGMLSAKLFGQLRQDGPLGGPILINAGRGRLQNEADIAAALTNGLLRGASLDVFAEEPLPASSPLWKLDNLFITPHVASVSDPAVLPRLIARQVKRMEAGEELQYLVDRSAGY